MIDAKTKDELREIAGRYPEARSGLLPMLHLVQSVEGRVTPEGISVKLRMSMKGENGSGGIAAEFGVENRDALDLYDLRLSAHLSF